MKGASRIRILIIFQVRTWKLTSEWCENIYHYCMANPVLGKSLCCDWLFLDQDFAVRTVSMEMVQSLYFCFGAKQANSKFATKTAEKKCEYCHPSHWNYQKQLKRLKFLPNFKNVWRRRTFLSASHPKCILLSETECHIISNLQTKLARAVLGNIGPRYSPCVWLVSG